MDLPEPAYWSGMRLVEEHHSVRLMEFFLGTMCLALSVSLYPGGWQATAVQQYWEKSKHSVMALGMQMG